MPCCCSSNIKAAKILGIILAVLYGLGIVYDFTNPLTKGNIFSIVSGFLGLASALILAYGGFTCNSKAMQIYIYSTIFLIILFIALAIWAVVEVFNGINSVDAKVELIKETCNEYRGTSNNYQECLSALSLMIAADQNLLTASLLCDTLSLLSCQFSEIFYFHPENCIVYFLSFVQFLVQRYNPKLFKKMLSFDCFSR